MNHLTRLLLLSSLLLVACGGVAQEEHPETFGVCEQHVRELKHNVNGCWRIKSRQGFIDEAGQYRCSLEPTCEVIPGDDQRYVSGDVAWVGDVECSNTCSPTTTVP